MSNPGGFRPGYVLLARDRERIAVLGTNSGRPFASERMAERKRLALQVTRPTLLVSICEIEASKNV